MRCASEIMTAGQYMFTVYPFEYGDDLHRVVGACACSTTHLEARDVVSMTGLSESRARRALSVALKRGILGTYARPARYTCRDWGWIDRNVATVERPSSSDWPAWIPPRGFNKPVRLNNL